MGDASHSSQTIAGHVYHVIHLVLQSSTDTALSHFMQWWFTSHVRRYHRHYHSHGHVWQGRFKSFLIQQDVQLLTVLRYVLRNPVRAGLVTHTYEWPWSSMHYPGLIDSWPVDVPLSWTQWIDAPLFAHELAAIRICVNRQAPFGAPAWQAHLAKVFGRPRIDVATPRPPSKTRNKVACPFFVLSSRSQLEVQFRLQFVRIPPDR